MGFESATRLVSARLAWANQASPRRVPPVPLRRRLRAAPELRDTSRAAENETKRNETSDARTAYA